MKPCLAVVAVLILLFSFQIFGEGNRSVRALGLCESSLSSDSLDGALREIDLFQKQEEAAVRNHFHRSRVTLQKQNVNGQEKVILAPRSIVMIHGLFNSPLSMENFENLGGEIGAHVFNVRLPGHFDKDYRKLDSVTLEDWATQIRKALVWASRLGDKVTIIGHSTGALVGIKILVDEILNRENGDESSSKLSDKVDSYVLFSPAFDLSTKVDLQTRIVGFVSRFVEVFHPPQGHERYLSAFAGEQVLRLIRELRGVREDEGFARPIEVLQDKHLLWIDTEADATLNREQSAQIIDQIAFYQDQRRYEGNRNLSLQHILLPRELNVSHANITTPPAPEAQRLQKELRGFLRNLKGSEKRD